jgi:opacity protein-like surface antigen
MRRVFSAVVMVLALAAAAPAGAQQTILERPPMELGVDQAGVLQNFANDLLFPPHEVNSWFEFGVSYPQGTLSDENWDAGLLLRAHHRFWHSDVLGLTGSFGVNFANDSYFNDAQDDFGNAAGSGASTQTRHYYAWPAMVNLDFSPEIGDGFEPILSAGPGVVWSSEALITNGIGSGVNYNDLDTLVIGPGGEQGVSPYDIKTRTRFNLGWNARLGVGMKVGRGDRPLWARAAISGLTWYQHTAPRTMLGFTMSLGR